MSVLIQDLFEQLSSLTGDSGVCATTEAGKSKIIQQYNIAAPTLIKRLDAAGTIFYWCFRISSGCFWLPEDCLEARQVWLNGRSMDQRDQWFQGRLGIGLERCAPWNSTGTITCGYSQLIDQGDGFAIPQPWPNHANTKAAFVAESNGDAGKIVRIRLKNEYGDEVIEEVVLLADRLPAVTKSHVTDIRSIWKPVTDGGVQLHVYYDHKGLRSSFAYYPAWVSNASFRRKTIPGFCPYGGSTILLKGKLRFRPIKKETDEIQITDGQALAFAFMAQTELRKHDRNGYNESMTLAVNELQKQLQNETSPAACGQIQYRSPFGRRAFQHSWGG